MKDPEVNRSPCNPIKMLHQCRRTQATFLLLLSFMLQSLVHAQERPPTVDQMHVMFENAARQANSQMSNTRVDDHTTLKMMTYDRKVPVMTYHYSSTVLDSLQKPQLDERAKRAMFEYHRTKTCSTQFAPFMRVYGLKVTHRFEDARTGREMLTVTISGDDCVKK